MTSMSYYPGDGRRVIRQHGRVGNDGIILQRWYRRRDRLTLQAERENDSTVLVDGDPLQSGAGSESLSRWVSTLMAVMLQPSERVYAGC